MPCFTVPYKRRRREYKLAVVVSGVAVGRQAAAGTRAGCGVRERAPPGFQERDAGGWSGARGEPARPCPSVPGFTRRLTARRCSTLKSRLRTCSVEDASIRVTSRAGQCPNQWIIQPPNKTTIRTHHSVRSGEMIWKKLKPGCFGNMVTNRQFILSWF